MFRFDTLAGLSQALRVDDHELALPAGEQAQDGEWVLAIFEVGAARGRATAAAARGVDRGDATVLVFEGRDWERLLEFSVAPSEQMRAASMVPPKLHTAAMDSRAPAPEPKTQPGVAPKPSHRPPSGSFRAPANTRVLVVDDDRDIRQVVGAMLDAVGLKVDTATSGEEALERIRSKSYDLMILDWNLPGMTGLELCRVIRREPSFGKLPVLFLTAHSSSKDIVEAFASGADDYVTKPFRAPELGARIFGLLRRTRAPETASRER